MNMETDNKQHWLEELEQFITHWEQETELLKEKQLDLNECDEITDVFHRNSDGLLVRRPVEISDEEIFTRLEQLDNKLGSVLAMACTSSEFKTTKKF